MTQEPQGLEDLSAELEELYRDYMRLQRRRFSWRAWFPGKHFYAQLGQGLGEVKNRARFLYERLSEGDLIPIPLPSELELARFLAEFAMVIGDAAQVLENYCVRLALKHQFDRPYYWKEMRVDSDLFGERHDAVLMSRYALDRFKRLHGFDVGR